MADQSYEKIVQRTDLDGASAEPVAHPLTITERKTLLAALKALSGEPTIDMNNVRVGIAGRELLLKGHVPGLATRARIEAIAEQVEGIDRVDNQLAVRR